MPAFEIRPVPRQDTAVIHLRCRPDAISATMGEAFGKVFAAIGQAGATPAGPVFSRYFEFGAGAVDFEVGAAVTAPFTGEGEVHAGELGGGDAAVGLHVGPYDTLPETYSAMQAWIVSQGRRPASSMWEVYLTDPQQAPDPATWQTEVYWPVW
jgi:effector-binding domain-containing protein